MFIPILFNLIKINSTLNSSLTKAYRSLVSWLSYCRIGRVIRKRRDSFAHIGKRKDKKKERKKYSQLVAFQHKTPDVFVVLLCSYFC